MNATHTINAHTIERTSLPRSHEILHTQVAAFLALLKGLDAEDWYRPTACARWRVRDVVAHMIGQAEEGVRPVVLLRRMRRGQRLYPALPALDGHNQCQVDDRRTVGPDELIDHYLHWSDRWLRAVRRLPTPLLKIPLSWVFPDTAALRDNSLDYLVKVLMARDVWMHRLDVADATSKIFAPANGDRDIVEQVISDLARDWTAPSVLLDLNGVTPARYALGVGETTATVTGGVLALMRHLAGRARSGDLVITGDPRVVAAMENARVEF
ncbi:maleylpyruvate isomerase family mycothiol-dependent enzyme [Nonomuraea sp. NPDC049141]|uniref:maleylpyruvate isomerase family mycothiol-dependent enzyme n=1 Tax=Nonomuraea sp. NPDC049141 TaxID=3155500 RepID=UPI0033C59EBE